MKYYDARIIEGCCVFSYTVEPPVHAEKASAEKRKNKSSFLKKMLLRKRNQRQRKNKSCVVTYTAFYYMPSIMCMLRMFAS